MATTQPLHFTDTETEQLVVYRPVNRWAVASVVLGLLSVSALLHAVFLVIPLTGLLSAIIAARQLKSAEVPQSGEAAMKWGIFLCLLFGTAAGTHLAYGQYRIQTEAQQCSEKWLQLFREGKLYEVHQLTITEDERAGAGVSLEKHYAPRIRNLPKGPIRDPNEHDPTEMMEMMQATPEEQFRDFETSPTVERLVELGDRAHYEFLRTSRQAQASPHAVTVEASFAVHYEEEGQPHRFVIRIMLERSQPGRIGIWRVLKVEEESSA